MANADLNKKISQHFAKLVELTTVKKLADKPFRKAIEDEIEDFLLSVVADQYDIKNAETVDFEDVKWRS